MIRLFFIFILMFFSMVSFSKDLGVHGRLFEIEEMDMRLQMMLEAAKIDWKKYNDELKKSAENYADNLPHYSFKQSIINKTDYIDPEIKLNKDIYAPVKNNNGKWEWRVLYSKGTKTNLLEHIQPNTRLFIFAGNNREQVEFAKKINSRFSEKVSLIMVNKNPLKLSEELGVPVYYITKEMIDYFEIEYLPVLIGIGSNKHKHKYAVTRFSFPYDIEVISKAWNGLIDE